MAKFPKEVFVTEAVNDDGPENLLAWKSLRSADEGMVAIYKLDKVVKKRDTFEISNIRG